MRWLKLTLAYDGSLYAGWQRQPGRATIQGTLEATLQKITGEPTRVTASGRTDAGVHAEGQVVGFSTESRLAPDVLQRALNAELPADIVVRAVEVAPEGFHATRDAVSKGYRYRLADGGVRPLFDRAFVWHVRCPLDVDSMRRAARPLVGRHDFASFESAGSERVSTVRDVSLLSVERRAGDRVEVDIVADGFLYNMVRAIVGSLVEVGRGARPEQWPAEVLAARDRKQAGPTAPPQGLVLWNVTYEVVSRK